MITEYPTPVASAVAPSETSLAEKILHFKKGLPGFPNHRQFIMSQRPEERPFAWMHSVEDKALTFVVVDAYAWCLDFLLEVDDETLLELGSSDPLEYAVYFIMRIKKEENGSTSLQANQQSPLIVNIRTRQAQQIIVPVENSKVDELCLKI